jgi:hypothetical protein
VPFAALSNLTLSTLTAEPGDTVSFVLTGFSANETVQRSWDTGPVKELYTADIHGSVHSTFVVDSIFGHHRASFVGLNSNNPRQLLMYIPPLMKISPSTAKAGDTVTVSSMLGWSPGSKVYMFWGKRLVATLFADGSGTIITPYVIGNVKPGIYKMKLNDTNGISVSAKVTITL